MISRYSIFFHIKRKVGIITTGKVFKGRIKDTFGPVIKDKLAEFPTEVLGQTYVDDEKAHITEAILAFIMKQIWIYMHSAA